MGARCCGQAGTKPEPRATSRRPRRRLRSSTGAVVGRRASTRARGTAVVARVRLFPSLAPGSPRQTGHLPRRGRQNLVVGYTPGRIRGAAGLDWAVDPRPAPDLWAKGHRWPSGRARCGPRLLKPSTPAARPPSAWPMARGRSWRAWSIRQTGPLLLASGGLAQAGSGCLAYRSWFRARCQSDPPFLPEPGVRLHDGGRLVPLQPLPDYEEGIETGRARLEEVPKTSHPVGELVRLGDGDDGRRSHAFRNTLSSSRPVRRAYARPAVEAPPFPAAVSFPHTPPEPAHGAGQEPGVCPSEPARRASPPRIFPPRPSPTPRQRAWPSSYSASSAAGRPRPNERSRAAIAAMARAPAALKHRPGAETRLAHKSRPWLRLAGSGRTPVIAWYRPRSSLPAPRPASRGLALSPSSSTQARPPPGPFSRQRGGWRPTKIKT